MSSDQLTIGEYANAMPDMSDKNYQALKQSIAEHGLEYPILVDRNGTIIDGHHRFQACQELGIEPETIVVNTEDDIERAYRPNLARRDFSSGAKREAVKQYLLEYWDGERTEEEVATDLGVAQQTVNNARRELRENGKLTKLGEFPTEEKRQQVREYIERHPDASNRDIANAVEATVSYRTVGKWRNEWSDDGKDEDDSEETLKAYAPTPDQADAATSVFQETDTDDETVADTAADQAEKVASGEMTPDRAATELERTKTQREQESRPAPSPPEGEYTVLYADPPWQYDHQQAPNRQVENHYPTMSIPDLVELDVPAADDSVCYLWATAPKLAEALTVLDAWGFDYTTCAVWDKEHIGMGYWFRGQHELLLVGKKGDVSPPEPEQRVSSVIRSPRGEHSEKPAAVAELIEDAFPDAPKIELFARDPRDGWDAWGDEL